MRAVIRHMAPNLTSDPTMPPVLMASNVLATVLKELKDQGMHPVPTRLICGQISTKQRWLSGNAPILGSVALQSSSVLGHGRIGFSALEFCLRGLKFHSGPQNYGSGLLDEIAWKHR